MTSWLIPGLNERLIELHALAGVAELSAREIARQLNSEFGTSLTRNGVIGRSHRLKLPPREAPIVRKYVTRKKPVMKKPAVKKPIEVSIAIDDAFAIPVPVTCEKRPLTIDRLRRCHCRWPDGDIDTSPPFIYCGKRTIDNSSWCEEHYNRAHVTPRKVWS